MKEEFISKYYPLAKKVEKKFGVSATVILAQASLESAWGTSYSAKNRKNFFGITAIGAKNPYWNGEKSQSSSSGLWFRIYKTDLDSFMDFGRLISVKYTDCKEVSKDSTVYAKCIANSPYITDKFDDRKAYEKVVKDRSLEINKQITEIEQKRRKKIISIIIISVILLIVSFSIYKIVKNK
jgi:flagellar protein FlgJ